MGGAGIHLYPFVLVRIAGGPLREIGGLEAVEACRLSARLGEIETRLERLRTAVAEALYRAIGGQGEDVRRQKLLALRRHVFNGRPVRAAALAEVAPGLPDEALGGLRAYAETWALRDACAQAGETRLAEELAAAGRRLAGLAGSDVLRKGLAFASDGFSDLLDRYLTVSPAAGHERAKQERAQVGAVKYLTRVHCKTSPFSTFTSVALAPVPARRTGAGLALRAAGGPASVIRANPGVCGYLKDRLAALEEVARELRPELNGSLVRSASGYVFLATESNTDFLRKVALHPLLEGIEKALGGARPPRTLNGLVRRLVRTPGLDAAPAEVAAFVRGLVRMGFLRLQLSTRALDPLWDESLARELEHRRSTAAGAEVATALAELGRTRRALASCAAAERAGLLHAAAGRVRDLEAWLEALAGSEPGRTAPRFPAQTLFYEDTHREVEILGGSGALREIAARIDRLLACVRAAEGESGRKRELRESFERVAAGRLRVGLIELYEGHYLRRPEAPEAAAGAVSAPWRELAGALVAGAPSGAEEIHLGTGDLAGVAGTAALAVAGESPLHCGALVQPFASATAPGGIGAVLSFACPGYGKMASRFLAAPRRPLAWLRASNARLGRDAMPAEIRDASVHSANVHPPLMPYEILCPGGEPRLPAARRIAIRDVAMELDGHGAPRLCHLPSGRSILPFDLDFEVERTRSRLFALLAAFSPAEETSPAGLVAAVNDAVLARERVETGESRRSFVLPRLVLDGGLVLQRRTWFIHREELPVGAATESAWQRLHRFDAWRRALGMPGEVFVSVIQKGHWSGLSPEVRARHDASSLKPQYISFRNPFLLRLLEQLCRKVPRGLTVVEMLPRSGQAIRLDGEPWVTEWLLQWSRTEA